MTSAPHATITGIGMSQIGRRTGRAAIHHLADAAIEALADAGLTRGDIDGIATYPGKSDAAPGISPLGIGEVRNALRLQTRFHAAIPEGPAQMAPVMVAAMAVMTGYARHVLCFRALTESSSQTPERRASVPAGTAARVGGWPSWLLPVNAISAANWVALAATRYFHEFGMTRDQLAMIAVQQRDNAMLNPRALHKTPLTRDAYFEARMISTPLGLFDCDSPIDGACVIIVSASDAARDTRKQPLRIEAFGAAMSGQDSWDQTADITRMAAHDAAADMWARTALTAADIDILSLYDGFSIHVPLWLEAFGFCGRGEAKDFIADGNTRLTGRYPVNTGGGQLSAGRLHGFGLLHESCVQLWGEGAARQVTGARSAVCGMGGGPLAGTVLLVRD